MIMRKKTDNTHLKVIRVLTQCSNGRNKLYPTHVYQSSRDGKYVADPLVVVADSKHATIQVLAFLDLLCSAIYSGNK
jgi:hypothetical protein